MTGLTKDILKTIVRTALAIMWIGGSNSLLQAATQDQTLPVGQGKAVHLGKSVDCTGNAKQPPGPDPVQDWIYTVEGIEIRVHPFDQIHLLGHDRFGTPWRVDSSYPGDLNCTLFIDDLDMNGYRDLIFLINSGGSGPDRAMLIIALDSIGRPVPWLAYASWHLTGNSILELVDLDGDGHAEVIVPYFDNGLSTRRAVRTEVYKMADGHFLRVDGDFAGYHFPIDDPTGASFNHHPNLSNAVDNERMLGAINDFSLGDNPSCGGVQVTLGKSGIMGGEESSNECEQYVVLGGKKIAGIPLITVIDLIDGERKVDIEYSPANLLRMAMDMKLDARLIGWFCEYSSCQPFVLWASANAPGALPSPPVPTP